MGESYTKNSSPWEPLSHLVIFFPGFLPVPQRIIPFPLQACKYILFIFLLFPGINIRLLNLPESVKEGLLRGKITEGHARALLGLPADQAILTAYKRIVKEHLSVRAIEELVRRINETRNTVTPKKQKTKPSDPAVVKYEKDLKNIFGKSLKISKSMRGGKIVIPFRTDKELEELYQRLLQK